MAEDIKKETEEVKAEFVEEKNDDEADKSSKKEPKKTSKLKEKLAERDKEIAKLKDQLLREHAELENFKKRVNQERINERKYASKNLIHDILVPLDMLKIIVNQPTDDEKLKNYLVGFKMVNDQLYQVLERDGLKEIEALNKQFDPTYHHAVEKVSDKDKANGINVEVIQKGYTYKEKLLRPAMVKVNEWSDENGENK